MPRKIQLKKHSSAASDTPKWRRDVPALFDSVCRYADLLDKASNIPPTGETITENRLREMNTFFYLERLEGYIEAIEAFTGIHYKFTSNDAYYGIYDDDGDFIYKVPRRTK